MVQKFLAIFFILFGIGDFLSLFSFPNSMKATVIIMPPDYVSLFVGLVFPVASVALGLMYYVNPRSKPFALAAISAGYSVLFYAAAANLEYWEYWIEGTAPSIRWYEMEVLSSALLFSILTAMLIRSSIAPNKASQQDAA